MPQSNCQMIRIGARCLEKEFQCREAWFGVSDARMPDLCGICVCVHRTPDAEAPFSDDRVGASGRDVDRDATAESSSEFIDLLTGDLVCKIPSVPAIELGTTHGVACRVGEQNDSLGQQTRDVYSNATDGHDVSRRPKLLESQRGVGVEAGEVPVHVHGSPGGVIVRRRVFEDAAVAERCAELPPALFEFGDESPEIVRVDEHVAVGARSPADHQHRV